MDTLSVTMPIFLLIALGYVLRLANITKREWVSVLNGFVYYVSLPALIILSFMKLDWNQADAARLSLANVLYLLISTTVLFILSKLIRLTNKDRAAYFVTASVSNSIYLGVPLSLSAFNGKLSPEVITLVAVIQLVGAMLLSLVMIEFFYLGSRNVNFIVKHFLKNPLFLSICAGLILSLIPAMSWLEDSIDKPLNMLSATASPVALFALGSFLHGHALRAKKILLGFVVFSKLFVGPLIAFVALRLLNIDGYERDVSVFAAAMPAAVTAFILAKTYKLDTTFVANAMLVTTIISIATLPLLLSLLG